MRQKRTTVQRPVNDCYLSPKPRRDDVPVTRPNTFSALTEMKHCEVPDSFHSLLYPILRSRRHSAPAHGAMLRHATLIALHRATLRSLRYHAPHNALLRFSMLFCATLRSIPLLILLYK